MILQPSGQPSGSADQRISGSADQRISGSADQRTSGSADQRISGSADQRISGPADQRISGSADQRISGSADQRTSGSADQRTSGSADQRTEPRDPRISSSTDSAKCYLFVLVNCFPHTRLPFAHCRFIPQEIVPLITSCMSFWQPSSTLSDVWDLLFEEPYPTLSVVIQSWMCGLRSSSLPLRCPVWQFH